MSMPVVLELCGRYVRCSLTGVKSENAAPSTCSNLTSHCLQCRCSDVGGLVDGFALAVSLSCSRHFEAKLGVTSDARSRISQTC